MNNNLFLCNTVYQVLVAVWFRYSELHTEGADIIISDHMNGYENIAKNIAKTKIFDHVYTVRSSDYVKSLTKYNNRAQRALYKLFPETEIKNYIKLNKKYNALFIGNVDKFSALLFASMSKKEKVSLNVFEDGVSTYSKLFESFYSSRRPPKNKLKFFLLCKLCSIHYIYPNVKCFYVFKKAMMQWKPDCEVRQLKPIACDTEFKKIINKIFDYNNVTDDYDKKYIFFEESFYADSGYMEDMLLVEKIAAIIGKENMMIKIHPRNPENRFEKSGYKTNQNTAVPWEVILLNNDFSGKVLMTIGSASIITPYILFNKKIKSLSFINCIDEKPAVLNSPLHECILYFYRQCNDCIEICSNINDITKY